MNHSSLFSYVTAGFVSVMMPLIASAETASFPKDKPLFSVELPAEWKVADSSSSELRLVGPFISNLSIEPVKEFKIEVTEENAKDSACGVNKSAVLNGEKGTCTEPEEIEIAGHTGYSVIGSGVVGKKQCIVFTPDGKNWFGAFANVGMDDKPDPKTAAVLSAIKGSGGGEE